MPSTSEQPEAPVGGSGGEDAESSKVEADVNNDQQAEGGHANVDTDADEDDGQDDRAGEYDCPLCLKLLHDPTTASCGHSFCRRCAHELVSSVNRAASTAVAASSSLKCPICRHALDRGWEPVPSLSLCRLLRRTHPQAYAIREEEEEEHQQTSIQRPPLSPSDGSGQEEDNTDAAAASAEDAAYAAAQLNILAEETTQLFEEWALLVVRNRWQAEPGQLTDIRTALGTQPPPAQPGRLALWISAVIDPQPPFAAPVAREIRPAVLSATTDSDRLRIVRDALLDSIETVSHKRGVVTVCGVGLDLKLMYALGWFVIFFCIVGIKMKSLCGQIYVANGGGDFAWGDVGCRVVSLLVNLDDQEGGGGGGAGRENDREEL